jgi:hypothetical protein
LIAVILEVWRHSEHRGSYLDLPPELRPHLDGIEPRLDPAAALG